MDEFSSMMLVFHGLGLNLQPFMLPWRDVVRERLSVNIRRFVPILFLKIFALIPP